MNTHVIRQIPTEEIAESSYVKWQAAHINTALRLFTAVSRVDAAYKTAHYAANRHLPRGRAGVRTHT